MSPRRYALVLSAGYFVVAAVYIQLSSLLARYYSANIVELWWIESAKGVFFIFVTSIALFVFSLGMFRNLRAQMQMAEQNRQALIDAEGRATVGLLAASIAHDCNNICTILRLSTERLKMVSELPEKAADALRRMDHGVTQLTALTHRMRAAGRQVVNDRSQEFDVDWVIREALEFVRLHREVCGCEVRFQMTDDIQMVGNPSLIHQLVMNLVLNAAQAMGGRGTIEVRLRRAGEDLEIEVHDNGPGIPEERIETLFSSFQTTKTQGAGLGLISVRSCAELFGGRVEVRNSPLGGACFRIILPLASRSFLARSPVPRDESRADLAIS